MKKLAPAELYIQAQHMQQMRAHVQKNLPLEACGLLAAAGGISQAVFPITNKLHSTVQFFMEPVELLAALEAMDAQDWQLQAIFHSHPNGPGVPSLTDLRESTVPEVPALIWYRSQPELEPGDWSCQAYFIDPGGYQPLALRVIT